MPGFNQPGGDYYKDDSRSLDRIAKALERIADKMEIKWKEKNDE